MIVRPSDVSREEQSVGDLAISLGCGPYDRTEALRYGEVRPAGIDLTYVTHLNARDIFARMVRNRAFDVAEMAGMYFLGRKAQRPAPGEFPFIGLPVFPSRRFRHGFVFVNADAGIEQPRDLEGRRIGILQFRNTASIWVRGILQNEYGVDLDTVEWVEGGLNLPASAPFNAGTRLEFEMHRPPDLTHLDRDQTLSDALADGRIDALISPRVPTSLRSDAVRRLFEDYPAEERAYYRRTGVFPIMHLLVMRQDLHDEHPWVAESLYDAFVASRDRALELLHRSGAAKTMLPWQISQLEEAEGLLGRELWSYGLESNRVALETLLTYLVQQGFVERPIELEEIFARVVETSQ